MYNRNLHDCIHFLSLLHYALDIFATRKYVNHRDEYGLVIPTNLQSLHFHGPEKAIKLAKKYNNKDQRNLKRNCKTLSKVKCIQISCKKCLILDVFPIERSFLGDNVSCDLESCALKESTTKRFGYESFFAISSVPEKSVRCREVSAIKDVHYKQVLLCVSG